MTSRITEPRSRRAGHRAEPRWAKRATQAMAAAGVQVRVIAANTPVNLRCELARLEQEWRTSGATAPRFAYEGAPDLGELSGMLDGYDTLGAIFAARARELCADAALCESAGTEALWPCARQRYTRRDRFDDEADTAAVAWLAEPPATDEAGPPVRSDDEGSPGSLVSRMRAELGRRRLPLRVIVKDNLASLAATGDGFVQVVAGRPLSARDVERTVLHEIEGHIAPRVNAGSARLGIFAVGTARGSDDQEGRALALERAAGFLDPRRRREIALRHRAARSVEARADFVDTVELLRDHGAPLEDALRIAARVHRGGGLARECVYLPALLRVEAALGTDPCLDRVLGAGRVAVDAAPALRVWVE